MSEFPISPVRERDRKRALDTLVLAFVADPVERWMFPEPAQYLASFPMFLAAFGGRAFGENTVWSLGDFAAVALWLPPGTGPDNDAVASVVAERVAPEKHEDLSAVGALMDAAHPSFPHWYLPWFGVDPAVQGQGLGADLLQHCLRVVDEDHLPAYLETPNPRNITLYERHGFETTGEARIGACPPVAFMLRPAQ